MNVKKAKKKRYVERKIYESNLFMWKAIEPPKWRIFKRRKWLKLKPKPPKHYKEKQ